MLSDYPEGYFNTGGTCIHRIDLHNTNGRDAVYIIRVLQDDDKFFVFTSWGKKGSILQNKLAYSQHHQGTPSRHSVEAGACLDFAKKVANTKRGRDYDTIFEGEPSVFPLKKKSPKKSPLVNCSNYLKDPSMDIEFRTNRLNSSYIKPVFYKDTYVFEPIPQTGKWMYISITNHQWVVFDEYGEVETAYKLGTANTKMHAPIIYHGYLFRAFGDPTNGYSITDFVSTQLAGLKVANLAQRPWKIRRAMLTYIFKDIYVPTVDVYDKKLDIRLNDYIQGEQAKRELVKDGPDDIHFLVRYIEDPLNRQIIQIDKVGKVI